MVDSTVSRFSNVQIQILLWTLLILVLPHFFHLPWSSTLVFLSLWGWRLWGCRFAGSLPRGRWVPFLALIAAALVIVSRHGAVDLDTSTGLFVSGLGLKLMELNQSRDIYLTIFLGWFVALTQFLYDQSFWMVGYALTTALLLTGVLIRLNISMRPAWKTVWQITLSLLLPALPIAVLLFLFFPRVTGPFWRLPLTNQAQTGLSDVMEPGSIADLTTNREVAFRVEFEGALPPPEMRYWRAQVFWRLEGGRWSSIPTAERPIKAPPPGSGATYHYTITQEPHHRHWLFSLGIPNSIPAEAILNRSLVLSSRNPVHERIRYSLISHVHSRIPPLSTREQHWALQLPAPPPSRIDALVSNWHNRTQTPQGIAGQVLDFFRDHGFVYTLHPERLSSQNPIEQFLFDTRRGFCEHYASAFVYLMRAAGIPARIVGGYLGGFYNRTGDFLEVYQSNAHAWAEIWVPKRGWVHYDPTQAVAPWYVEHELDMPDPASLNASAPEEIGSTSTAVAPLSVWKGLNRQIHIVWSSVNHGWHRWVLNYGVGSQTRLFQYLRSQGWMGIKILLGIPCAIILIRQGYRWREYRRRPPAVRHYERLLKQLQRKGVSKRPHEAPREFARRARLLVPDRSEPIEDFTEGYLAVRYGKRNDPQ
ncbi:transglutaminase TgpA family protein [Methylohalobius crimeensis]|uniref:transglutaminase TgpA family protein n=1 Tax=Methylohalobius crimeensis TaxID=244365 RepID=UPI0003B7B234|nr:DUF3488 and transglutaminase-like domain-containing protein [Methylohalobius crimeensis]